jgi:precorrin-6B methylase 2
MIDNEQRITRFLDAFRALAPIYFKQIRRTVAAKEQLFMELAGPMLQWANGLLGDNYETRLIESYVAFVDEVNQAQDLYEKNRRYQSSNFSEVYKRTYNSRNFMNLYYWGVYVITFAWEHHLELYQFYRDEFLSRLQAHPKGNCIDFGAGSALWTMLALNRLPGWRATAVDISETAVQLSRDMANQAGLQSRISFAHADALEFRMDEPANAAVSCFLLEHLEQPGALLNNIARSVHPRDYAFLTVALTAAEVDHIYEFRRESEIVELAEASGFRAVAMLSAAPNTIPPQRYFLPRSVGFVLQRRAGDIW